MKRAPLTKRGVERLRIELERLKSVERPRIIAAIAEARAHGDLKENAEYHAAREQQSFVEGRIQMLEGTLSFGEIIDVSKLAAGARVVFGATVELIELHSNEESCYQIVGEIEADIKQRLISINSPMARALIGKSEGDTVELLLVNGNKSYEIVGVRYE
ncbi:MAG: transcription elongation factor GreA [Lysobacterales bacterium CG02_land_8_20_14_3_00_62_12]|nr:MAG: transcription elongation factor GreA [Xanthomonadales bacterium CG02_land_8_20_14_3_00_62_12]